MIWRPALPALLGLLLVGPVIAQTAEKGAQASALTNSSTDAPARFVDVTKDSGVHFHHQALHTSRKYLLETMGSGVALFDCDNDGRLDLFLANGAP